MIAILLIAALIAAALVLLLARYAPPIGVRSWRRGSVSDRRPLMPLPLLRQLTVDLLGALGLTVVEEPTQNVRRLMATKREPMGEMRYVVVLDPAPRNGLVDQAAVLALAQDVKSERTAVGMLITPGEIETAGLAGLDVKLELLDGPRFRALIAEHLPGRLHLLDQYRGLGSALPSAAPLRQHPAA